MKLYIDVFILGATLSWGPCLSFCAPILLPYIGATQKGWLAGLKVSLAFSLARIVPYVILSLVSATLGQYLIQRFYQADAGSIIYTAAGAFIAFLGIIILLGKSAHLHICPPVKKIGAQGVQEMIVLGLLVGFAPCLPLIGLLTYIAFNVPNFLQGMLLGLTFGVGTLISPLVLCAPLVGAGANLLLKKPLLYKIFSRLCGLILLYFGIGMILR